MMNRRTFLKLAGWIPLAVKTGVDAANLSFDAPSDVISTSGYVDIEGITTVSTATHCMTRNGLVCVDTASVNALSNSDLYRIDTA